ncbi:polyphosphate kinase 2 [Terrarubrum flagellatum]|uniref:polyphosphate kinase 2 n=1 Tax=Terrirubrum flagellatum TaxID=2895980 RepID=UPI00314566E5
MDDKADRAEEHAGIEAPEPAGVTLPFNIADPKFPKSISEAAFRSGGYPHDHKMDEDKYEKELLGLQIELIKLQNWIKEAGERLVIVFEGRDGAGKGGAILRFTQHLNPRSARVVALPKPTEVEKGQWHLQRYISQMPTKGEIVLFDRSWYNRAGVERVMGFCSEEEARRFLHEVPEFEKMLTKENVRLVKFFFSIGREMQLKRLHNRYHDPLKRWKLSPIDFAASEKWDAYSDAFDALLEASDTKHARWTIIKANDKMRTRLNAIRHVLWMIPYQGRDESRIGEIDDEIVLGAKQFLKRGGEE